MEADPDAGDIEVEGFLRALLRINSEDAARAREDAARAAQHHDDTDDEAPTE